MDASPRQPEPRPEPVLGCGIQPAAAPVGTAEERTEALRRALESRGVAVEEHRLEALPGAPLVGYRAELRSCSLAFRIDEPGLLLLLDLRRRRKSPSLRNPFADLIAFLELATAPRFGASRVMGHIATEPHPDGDGLSDARLQRFYERFFDTSVTRHDHGEWLYCDIVPLRQRLAEVRHQAAPLGGAPLGGTRGVEPLPPTTHE